jgi:hypothetical protein
MSMDEKEAARALGERTGVIYVPRDLMNAFQGDAIGQQAQLIKERVLGTPPPPPPDYSPTPPFQPPADTPSATVDVAPSPPPLTDLLAVAGLSDAHTVGGAVGGAASALGTAASSVIPAVPSLGDFLQQAGLGVPPPQALAPEAPAQTMIQGHYGSVDEIPNAPHWPFMPAQPSVDDRYASLQAALNSPGQSDSQSAPPDSNLLLPATSSPPQNPIDAVKAKFNAAFDSLSSLLSPAAPTPPTPASMQPLPSPGSPQPFDAAQPSTASASLASPELQAATPSPPVLQPPMAPLVSDLQPPAAVAQPVAPAAEQLPAPAAGQPTMYDQVQSAVRTALTSAAGALPPLDLAQPAPSSPLGKEVAGQPVTPVEQLQAVPPLFQGYEASRQQAIENLNPAKDVSVVGGAINMIANIATDPVTYVAGGPIDSVVKGVLGRIMPEATPAILNAAAEHALTGFGWGLVQGTELPDATPQSVLEAGAAGAALNLGVHGVSGTKTLKDAIAGSPEIMDALQSRQGAGGRPFSGVPLGEEPPLPQGGAPVAPGTAGGVVGGALLEDALKAAPSADAAAAARQVTRNFDVEKLADLRAQFQPEQPRLLDAARKAPDWLDRVVSFTTANMLSGVGTAVQNTLGNLGSTVARPIYTAAGGHPIDAMRDVTAMAASISDAFAAYGQTLRTGAQAGSKYETNLPGGLLAPLSVPLRNLAATDAFFRTLNSAGGAASHASRLLRENPGLTFDEVLQRFPTQIVDAGADAAARSVFEKGGGAAGMLGDELASYRTRMLRSDVPAERAFGLVLQVVAPMTRVPGVILGEGIRSLPGVNEVRGIQRAVQLASRGQHYEAQTELGKTALTSFVNLAILSEVAQGNVTGDGPTNPEERARLMEAVDQDGNAIWRPNSVRLPGGKWLDYSGLGPVALPMSSIANAVDTAQDWAQKPVAERGGPPELAGDLLGREASTISNAWYLRGIADVLAAVKTGNVGSLAGSQIGSVADRLVPAESLLNEIRHIADPYAREPGDPLQREENRVPFASRLVPPRIASTTGLPVEAPEDIFSTLVRGTPSGMMTPNPVAAEIARLDDTGNRVAVPSPAAQYAGARQTPEQQRLIQEQIGQATNLYVLDTINRPNYAGLTDQQKAAALNLAHAQAKEAANISLAGQVARDPHESALMQWAETPHYYGVSSKLPPEQIARTNWEIAQARAKLADYRKQYGPDQGEARLAKDDKTAYNLTLKYEPIETEVLAALKAKIDKATGGALLQKAQQAATGGLVGVGSTTLPVAATAAATPPPALPTSPPMFAARAASAASQPLVTGQTVFAGASLPTTPPISATDQFRAQQNASIRAAQAKLAQYRELYGDQAEARLLADDPQAWTLSRQAQI